MLLEETDSKHYDKLILTPLFRAHGGAAG